MNSQGHNKHIHPGRPSSIFFTSDQILNRLDIGEGMTILDGGCGGGFISIAASKLVGESGMVYAVDLDAQSIEALKREIDGYKIKNIKAIREDISKTLPIADTVIDICLMVNVFHGLVENDEVHGALKEIKRVLKYGGKLVVVDFKKMSSSPGPPEAIRLEPDRIESIIRRYSLEKRFYSEIGKYHYALIFENL